MYFILYTSQGKEEPSSVFFTKLLEQCHRNNIATNITGLLLYHAGHFMQIIEGNKEDVTNLYHIISQDKRHDQILILEQGEQEGRNFPDWAMGFKFSFENKNNQGPNIIDLNANQLIFEADKLIPHPALKHLKAFYSLIE